MRGQQAKHIQSGFQSYVHEKLQLRAASGTCEFWVQKQTQLTNGLPRSTGAHSPP